MTVKQREQIIASACDWWAKQPDEIIKWLRQMYDVTPEMTDDEVLIQFLIATQHKF